MTFQHFQAIYSQWLKSFINKASFSNTVKLNKIPKNSSLSSTCYWQIKPNIKNFEEPRKCSKENAGWYN